MSDESRPVQEIIFPDITTERRDQFNRRVRDCPKCKGDMIRKYT
jgi:hypothetical protein